jgi:hypothetical protein
VRAGETRFEATLADAGRWVAFLRNEIGEIAIVVRVGEPGVSVSVDGRQVEVVHDPSVGLARARLWHEPGRARIRARAGQGAEQSREIGITAGTTQSVTLDLAAPASAPVAPAPAADESDHSPPVASWLAFGVGGAGFVVLAIAGGLARAKMSELDDCRPNCTKEQTDDASTKATVANVGLVVGIAGAVVGGAIWIGAEATRSGPSAGGVRAGATFSRSGAALSLGGNF